MEKKTSTIPWSRLQALMGAAGINQAAFARRLNVATAVVTNWKQRGGAPYGRAAEIAKALSVSIEALLVGPVPDRMKTSRSAQRLVERIQALDRGGRISKEVEDALNAVLDLAGKLPAEPGAAGQGRD